MDKIEKLVKELRKTQVNANSVIICMGCEHQKACGVHAKYCGVHGCALMREAADTIERLNSFDKTISYRLIRENKKLEEELAELKDKLRWRVAAHELPKNDAAVLISVSGIFGSMTFHNVILIGSYIDEEGWIIYGCEEWENPIVSHWIPIPNIPDWEKDDQHE